MTTTPCVGHSALYDAALYPDDEAPAEERTQAVHTAAALCDGCPIASTCTERVTVDTAPRELALLPDNWLPAEREGRPEPEAPKVRTWSAERRAGTAITVGRDYVRPAQRPTAWARMAAQLASEGRTVEQIAEALCVSENTARALLGTTDTANHPTRKAA